MIVIEELNHRLAMQFAINLLYCMSNHQSLIQYIELLTGEFSMKNSVSSQMFIQGYLVL